MLIGISGSHCSGKSTLIDAFCERHPEFTRLAEPYEELDEVWSEVSTEAFLDQLQFQVEQLRSLAGDHVIVERTPLDSVAYLLALNDLGRSSFNADRYIETARLEMDRFDFVVFVPTDEATIYVPDEEDRELREAVNERLRAIVINDEWRIIQELRPQSIEVFGSTLHRVETIESALCSGMVGL